MNAESERVDADQCACWRRQDGCRCKRTLYVIAVSLYSTHSMTGNERRDFSNGWDGLQYGALHTQVW